MISIVWNQLHKFTNKSSKQFYVLFLYVCVCENVKNAVEDCTQNFGTIAFQKKGREGQERGQKWDWDEMMVAKGTPVHQYTLFLLTNTQTMELKI